MKKVRIGVFGLGRGGFAVRYCNIAKNAEVVAICDRLVDKLDRFRAEGIACFRIGSSGSFKSIRDR